MKDFIENMEDAAEGCLFEATPKQVKRLVQDCKNNLRAALQAVGSGVFMDCGAE